MRTGIISLEQPVIHIRIFSCNIKKIQNLFKVWAILLLVVAALMLLALGVGGGATFVVCRTRRARAHSPVVLEWNTETLRQRAIAFSTSLHNKASVAPWAKLLSGCGGLKGPTPRIFKITIEFSD